MRQTAWRLGLLLPVTVLLLAANATDGQRGASPRPDTDASTVIIPGTAVPPAYPSPMVTHATDGMAASYSIRWYSLNGGGAIGTTSPSYRLSSSVGQSATGAAASANYGVGVGFWYGAGEGCDCPHQGDMQLPSGSGAIDVNDVLAVIKIAFVNGTDVQDPQCPKTRSNVNNLGPVDVNDVLYIIKTAFSNGPAPLNPCP